MNQHTTEVKQRTDLERLISIANGKQVDANEVRDFHSQFLSTDSQMAYERTLEYIDQRERVNRKIEEDYK